MNIRSLSLSSTSIYLFLLSPAFLLASLDTASASSDGCLYEAELEYERIDLSPCYQDLPYVDFRNDSRGNLRLLLNAYLKEQPEASAQSETTSQSTSSSSVADQSSPPPATMEQIRTLVDQIFAGDSAKPQIPLTRATGYDSADSGDVRASNSPEHTYQFLKEVVQFSPPDQARSIASRRLELFLDAPAYCKKGYADLGSSSEFSKYADGAGALYCLDYAAAAGKFCDIADSKSSWINDAALYSCGRSLLLASQQKWDGYGALDTAIDKALAQRAREKLELYEKTLPEGHFVESARGLNRRADYFLGNWERYLASLSAEFSASVADVDRESADYYADEFDHLGLEAYNLNGAVAPQALLAADTILLALRQPNETHLARVTAALDVSANKQDIFSSTPGLREYLSAALALKSGQRDTAAQSRPAAATPVEIAAAHFAVSAAALEQLGRIDDSIKVRRELLALVKSHWPAPEYDPFAPEKLPLSNIQEVFEQHQTYSAEDDNFPFRVEREKLALLRTYLNGGRLAAALKLPAEDVPPWALQAVVQKFLNHQELQKIFQDESYQLYLRGAAGRSLVRILIGQERFGDAVALFEKIPDGMASEFEPILADLKSLAKSPDKPESITALANFLIDLDNSDFTAGSAASGFGLVLPKEQQRGERELEGAKVPFERYEAAISLAKQKHNREAEAEAVAKSLNCFRNGSWGWSCLGHKASDIESRFPKEARKALFNHLKKDLKGTTAADEQKYWY